MSITINYYPKKNRHFSLGLGQDVGTLRSLIDVVQLFIPNSQAQKKLIKRFDWRISDQKLKSHLIDVLTTSPVSPTVLDLTSEYKKEPGLPASIYAKSIIGAWLDGQKLVRDNNGNILQDIDGNNRRYPMRGWPLRNYLSVAIGFGLLHWDRTSSKVTITPQGRLLANTEHGVGEEFTKSEIDVLIEIFMSYPYFVGFLRALSNSCVSLNKFQLGESFGFANEAGFSSYGGDLYIESLSDALKAGDNELAKEIRSNWESTADKYIRQFGSILSKLNLVKKEYQIYKIEDDLSFKIPSYKITGKGKQALGIASGISSHKRSVKFVMWDMLASKGEVVYIRTVRALILKFLSESAGLNAEELASKINSSQIQAKHVLNNEIVTAEEVSDHIDGLIGIGLEIIKKHNLFILKDKISDFEIPVNGDDLPKKSNVMHQQDEIRPLLKSVDHRYLQLIELALDSSINSEYSQFESLTMEFIMKQLGFEGIALGGSNKPDGVAWDTEKNTIIVDTKAYDKGYSLAGNTDKVFRYITDLRAKYVNNSNPWWQKLPNDLNVQDRLKFIYVSGTFTGNYLKLLNDLRFRANTDGGLVEVAKLLLTGEKYLIDSSYGHTQLLSDWTNDQVLYDDYYNDLVSSLLNYRC